LDTFHFCPSFCLGDLGYQILSGYNRFRYAYFYDDLDDASIVVRNSGLGMPIFTETLWHILGRNQTFKLKLRLLYRPTRNQIERSISFDSPHIMPPSGIGRIAIIGAGSVGSTCAYALLLHRVSSEILLVDIDTTLLQAQVQDLSDTAFLTNTQVRSSTFVEAGQCDIIVITAGAKQREGESRIGLLDRNYRILESVIGSMKPFKEDAVLLLVSNPVDVLTYFAQKMSGLPRMQVMGSGTFLDTVRLRSALAEQIQVTTYCPISIITKKLTTIHRLQKQPSTRTS